MHREGHVGAALVAYAPVSLVTIAAGFEDLALVGAGVAAVLALIPDYDLRIPLLEHRGLTHTVWFALVIGTIGGLGGLVIGRSDGLLATVGLTAFGFVVGTVAICSHIVADALTPMGVTPFIPYHSRTFGYDVARASNPIANYLLLALGGGLTIGALALGNFIAHLG